MNRKFHMNFYLKFTFFIWQAVNQTTHFRDLSPERSHLIWVCGHSNIEWEKIRGQQPHENATFHFYPELRDRLYNMLGA